jgi:IS30 family transposase
MEDCGADAVLAGFSRVLDSIDAQKRLSITDDRGKEMAKHEELTSQTGGKANFANPIPSGSVAPMKIPMA